MKSTGNHKLFKRLVNHVADFWMGVDGLPRACVIALSGGIDSTLLLVVVAAMGKKFGFKVRAVHVDHGTQKEQPLIEGQLQKLCNEQNVELIIVRAALDILAGNFEATARTHRLNLLKRSLQKDEVLVFGHHIDDSLEWSLMQSFRASTVKPALGIPVINGRRVRPFMCLTRSQIARFHREFELWGFEDPTNNDERFSRNHLRRVIAQEIAPKYPNYLQHYVARSNDLAKKLRCSVFKTTTTQIIRRTGVRALFSASMHGQEELLVKLHTEISKAQRGSVRREIAKIVKAFKVGRQGPHQLSGDVKVWCVAGVVILANSDGQKWLQKKWNISSHIPEQVYSPSSQPTIFTLVLNPPARIASSAIKSHPLVKLPPNSVLVPSVRMRKLCRGQKLNLQWLELNL